MKKSFLAFLAFAVITFSASALPGVNHFIKDSSGEYVYYRDRSFTRESYIGFLTYDELTYAARYYAPASGQEGEKVIEFLFTLDGKKSYIDISGERFLTSVAQEDVEIVNYIHDLVYELGKRRQRIGEISPRAEKDSSINPSVKYVEDAALINSGFKSHEEFLQFGGNVFIFYDYLVPIFNIKKIVSPEGSMLEVVATGLLKSSDDRSFSSFKPLKLSEHSVTHKQKVKKPAAKKIDFEKSSITLDENWTQAGQVENFYFYGDAAMLGVGTIESQNLYLYVKMALVSSPESFVAWDKISFTRTGNRITVKSPAYTGGTDSFKINSFLLKNNKLAADEYEMLSLVVNMGDYNNERKYFTDVLESWK